MSPLPTGHAQAQLTPRLIQCDERLPECTQCKRHKKKCPGAITDTFFVICSEGQDRPRPSSERPEFDTHALDTSRLGDKPETLCMDESDSRVQQHETARSARKRRQAVQGKPDPCRRRERHSLWKAAQDGLPALRWSSGCLIPSCYQPSRADPFEQLFFSHFFETHGRGLETIRACSWLSKIPMLLFTSFKSPAMKYSTRAACMAFYGALNGQIPIQVEARKTYLKALESQRFEMYGRGEDCTTSTSTPAPMFASEEAICTSIMMSYFEMVTASSFWAWEKHLQAAASMLELRGPEQCQGPFVHQLFRTVRMMVVSSRSKPLVTVQHV